jgi:hypothetical protein
LGGKLFLKNSVFSKLPAHYIADVGRIHCRQAGKMWAKRAKSIQFGGIFFACFAQFRQILAKYAPKNTKRPDCSAG